MRKPTAKELILGCIAIAVVLTVIGGILQRTREPELSEDFKETIRKSCEPLKNEPKEFARCMQPIEDR